MFPVGFCPYSYLRRVSDGKDNGLLFTAAISFFTGCFHIGWWRPPFVAFAFVTRLAGGYKVLDVGPAAFFPGDDVVDICVLECDWCVAVPALELIANENGEP